MNNLKYTILFFSFLICGVLSSQNIEFSYTLDNTDKANIEIKIFARSTGADEGLLGYTVALYYNSADASFKSYDESPAQSLGWVTAGNFNVNNSARSNSEISVVHDMRLELQQFDGGFVGSTISNEAIHVGTIIFEESTTAFRSFAAGDVYLANSAEDGAGIIYISGTGDGFPTTIEGPQVQNLLPVTYSHFTARKYNSNTLLSWETVAEIDNNFFNVERSADGKNFETIGKVLGNGTTTEVQNYEFTDRAPLAGLNYYRLKQVDFNGEYEYTKVQTVDFRDGTEGDIKIFPNPAVDFVNITLDRRYESININNQVGQRIATIPANEFDDNVLKLNVSGYAPGVYYLEANLGTEIVNKQFVKVK